MTLTCVKCGEQFLEESHAVETRIPRSGEHVLSKHGLGVLHWKDFDIAPEHIASYAYPILLPIGNPVIPENPV